MSRHNRTRLENLPNELWFDIMDYLKVQDIYQAFFGLNERIDCILRSLKDLSFCFASIKDVGSRSVGFFAKSIDRLQLSCSQTRAIDLTRFPNVHLLKIELPSNSQITQIRPEIFPHLSSLTIGFLFRTLPALSTLHQFIFSNGFPLLHTCILISSFERKLTWSVSPALRSVSIYSSNWFIFRDVLTSCPNLVRLLLSGQIGTPIPNSTISSNHPLKFLTVRGNGWSKSTLLSSILVHVPNLERLFLKSRTINFVQLAHVLAEHVPRLQRFDCDVLLPNSSNMEIDEIRQLHPCFARMKRACYHGDYIRITTTKDSFN